MSQLQVLQLDRDRRTAVPHPAYRRRKPVIVDAAYAAASESITTALEAQLV